MPAPFVAGPVVATCAPSDLSAHDLGELAVVALRTGVDLAGQRPAMLYRPTAAAAERSL